MEKIFRKNEIVPLLGNEAIVLGALEAGVGFVSTYPGTPASEIGNVFYKLKEAYGVTMEYSTNEKVALEAAAGASYAGVRSLAAMKHFGANVALDALIPIAYTKPRAGLVLVVADDPGCHSSAQSEQDSRVFAENLHCAMLEPSDPAEAKEFTKTAFQMSEQFHKIVILRITTRVAHQTGTVSVGGIRKPRTRGSFRKDPQRFIVSADRLMDQKREMLSLRKEMERYVTSLNLNPVTRGTSKDIGIIASGVSYLHAREAMERLGVSLPVLKIDTYYPLPVQKIKKFANNKRKLFVAEEVLGLIEEKVHSEITGVEVIGKDVMEPVGELDPDRVTEALARVMKRTYRKPRVATAHVPERTPRLCEGCPYWPIFTALKKVLTSKKATVVGDIGCHKIGYYPPFELHDVLLCMGASVGVAHGIAKTDNRKVIALIGDSCLLHSGFPGVLNIVNNCSNPLIIVFENGITAMTGRQPHPATPLEFKKHDGKAEVDIRKLFDVIGMEYIVVDPVKEMKKLEEAIESSYSEDAPKAIICRLPCIYIGQLEKGKLRL